MHGAHGCNRGADAKVSLKQTAISKQPYVRAIHAYCSYHDVMIHIPVPLRHQLSLFAHISKITWKLHQNERHIAGTVSDPKTGDLRPFDMDDAVHKDAFQVVNSLWDIV